MREETLMDFSWKFFNDYLQLQNNTYLWGGAKSGAFSNGATACNLDDS